VHTTAGLSLSSLAEGNLMVQLVSFICSPGIGLLNRYECGLNLINDPPCISHPVYDPPCISHPVYDNIVPEG
jgi:hypothetical protein